MTERQPSVGIGVIIRRDGLVLIGLRNSGIQPGTWGLPGGLLAFGETWDACARREVREETGLEVISSRHIGTTETFAPDRSSHEITLFLEAEARGEVRNAAPAETARWEWRPWNALPAPRVRSLDAFLRVHVQT